MFNCTKSYKSAMEFQQVSHEKVRNKQCVPRYDAVSNSLFGSSKANNSAKIEQLLQTAARNDHV